MIGTPTRIVLTLTPDRIRGAVVRAGRIVRAEQIETDPTAWEQAWEQGLVPLDRPLRQLLSRLSPGRSQPRITLLYHARNAIVQSHEIAGSRDDARRAATVKIRESGGSIVIADAAILGPTAEKPGTWTVLALADREDDTNKLYAWLTRCGTRVERLIPEAAAIVRIAADRVLTAENETTACCCIGPGWSVIAVGSRDGLRLVRAFEFGHRLLSDVFQRAIRPDDAEADQALGERMLFDHGLPFKSTEISPEVRARILPMVAPVLQRFCVEIKQTLRFGIPADQQPSTLILDGPGAAIPYLASAVTDTVNMHIRVAPGCDGAGVLKPFAPGTFEYAWVRAETDTAELIPHAVMEQKQSDTFRRCLAAGAIGAAALLGAEYVHITGQNRELEPRFAQHATTLAALSREEEARERINRLAGAAGRVALRVTESAGPSADWPAVLALIAENASEHARFDEIDAQVTATGPEIRLKGSTVGTDDTSAAAALTEVVQALQASPLVTAINLGSTTRDTLADDRAVRHFQLTLRLATSQAAHQPLADYARRAGAAKEQTP
ncbi:MAG: hypothetical protein LAT64_05820 [Phycisphaerales bacterium]|nr:hypothetical protein [Planctomycetota bacterium]MCH8508274.1 hypothetical protein [Phycisphaerales bacterium]